MQRTPSPRGEGVGRITHVEKRRPARRARPQSRSIALPLGPLPSRGGGDVIRVQSEPFNPAAELAALQKESAGAVASFIGLVRGGDDLEALILDHYPGFTESEIARIEAEARARFDLIDTRIIHRYGEMKPAEAIVLVAASSKHRRAALQAVDFLMDYLKTEAPFWKREIRTDGSAHWIEPRSDDRAARAAWEKTE